MPAILALSVAATAGCGASPGTAPGDTIEREAFIATYVDLRIAALDSEGRMLTDTARTRVLTEHRITEDDLMTFAEVHGADVEFMNSLWDEVELRMDALRPEG